MKTWLVAAATVALLGASAARADQPAGFYESLRLEPAASFVAGKPVKVWCANSQADWVQYGGRDESFGLAIPGGNIVNLAPVVCRYLRAKIITPNGLGASLLVLTHESIHARGETDEGVTDCAAVHEMPRVAVKFFKVRPGKQLRAVMANAWNYRDREVEQYRTIC